MWRRTFWDDLAPRLKSTRFFDDLDNEEEYYGLSTDYLNGHQHRRPSPHHTRSARPTRNGESGVAAPVRSTVTVGAPECCVDTCRSRPRHPGSRRREEAPVRHVRTVGQVPDRHAGFPVRMSR
jgi:hypothetical protein